MSDEHQRNVELLRERQSARRDKMRIAPDEYLVAWNEDGTGVVEPVAMLPHLTTKEARRDAAVRARRAGAVEAILHLRRRDTGGSLLVELPDLHLLEISDVPSAE